MNPAIKSTTRHLKTPIASEVQAARSTSTDQTTVSAKKQLTATTTTKVENVGESKHQTTTQTDTTNAPRYASGCSHKTTQPTHTKNQTNPGIKE